MLFVNTTKIYAQENNFINLAYGDVFSVVPLEETDPQYSDALRCSEILSRSVCTSEKEYKLMREAQKELPILRDLYFSAVKANTQSYSEFPSIQTSLILVGGGIIVGIILCLLIDEKKQGFPIFQLSF